MNYDPNLTNSGRMATQTVKLTFGIWEYRKEMIVEIGGNCTGLAVIRSAVSSAFDQLPVEKHGKLDVPYIVMEKNGGEDTMKCEDDDDDGEDWLADMLVGAEITAIADQDKADAALVESRKDEPTSPMPS